MLATGLLVFECAGPMGAAMVRSRGSAWHLEGGDAIKVVATTSCGSRRGDHLLEKTMVGDKT